MLRHLTVLLLVIAGIGMTACTPRQASKPDYNRELAAGANALREVPIDRIPPIKTTPQSRAELRRAISHSRSYLAAPSTVERYKTGIAGLSLRDIDAGLALMAELLQRYPDDAGLDRAFRAQFRAFASIGWDGTGTVLFTAYYTPVVKASRVRTPEYRYPIYTRPSDLSPNPNPGHARNTPARRLRDGEPYPDAATLEASGELAGSELAWFNDRWQAYVIGVQGSAVLHFTDGTMMEVGYADTNGYPYVSVGQELAKDGKLPDGIITMPAINAYFAKHPEMVDAYIRRNPRLVFFGQGSGGPKGSIGRPVTGNVSIATDKTIFPPGALTFVKTTDGNGAPLQHFAVDQDTGSAIRAPGRCDLYLGIGPQAEAAAGRQMAEGRLFYLVAR